jgi:hypothetical protein
MHKALKTSLLLAILFMFGVATVSAKQTNRRLSSGSIEETDLTRLDPEHTQVFVRNLPVVAIDRSSNPAPLGTPYSFENGQQLVTNKSDQDPASYKSATVFCKIFVSQKSSKPPRKGKEVIDLSKEEFPIERVVIGSTTLNLNPRVDHFQTVSNSAKLGAIVCFKSAEPASPVTLEEIRAALGTKVEFQVQR